MEMNSTESRKRSRVLPDWAITLDDASSFRSIVVAANSIMQRVTFKTVKIDEVYYLITDGSDHAYTCFMSARIVIDKISTSTPNESFEFCVDCKSVLISIDNPSCAHCSLIIEGHDSSILLRLVDTESPSHEELSRLDTFFEGDSDMNISPIQYHLTLEIDTGKLREMIKKGKKCNAEHLRINIFTRSTYSKEQSMVLFSVKGGSYHEQKFCHETSKDDSGAMVIRAAADGNEATFTEGDQDVTIIDHTYPIEKIDAFVRNLSNQMMVAKMMKGMPLMLTQALGGTEDNCEYIRFLIAPVNDNE
jgi:hypothetical protein